MKTGLQSENGVASESPKCALRLPSRNLNVVSLLRSNYKYISKPFAGYFLSLTRPSGVMSLDDTFVLPAPHRSATIIRHF